MNTTAQSDTITGIRVRWYDTLMKAVGVRAVYAQALSLLAPKAGERILDVGCGTGTFFKLVQEQTNLSLTLVGIDASEEMIQKAREKVGGESIQFQFADAAYLPFPNQSFDAIVSLLTLHHTPSGVKTRAIMEMSRVLRTGGRAVVCDLARPSGWWGRVIALFLALHSYTRGNWTEIRNELIRWRFVVRKEGTLRGVTGYLLVELT